MGISSRTSLTYAILVQPEEEPHRREHAVGEEQPTFTAKVTISQEYQQV